MPTAPRQLLLRSLALVALLAGFVVIFIVLFERGSAYVVHARFQDAGQLVKGDLVEVGGKPIGTITKISLTDDNQADIEMRITDGEYDPLHQGTIATIRQVGQAGVANRYVELTPGDPGGAEIADEGAILATETRGAVDLDQLFASLDPETRKNLQSIIRNGAKIFAGTALDANEAFGYLSPALSELSRFTDDVVQDQAALSALLRNGARTSRAISSVKDDLQNGIASSATALNAVASEQAALVDILDRSPAFMRRTGRTLRNVRSTINAVLPATRELRRATPSLARVLRLLVPTARELSPVLEDVRSLLPSLRRGLNGLPAVQRVATPALRETTKSLTGAMPVFAGLRPFTPDLVSGLGLGFGGSTAGYYDANGHYARVEVITSAQGGTIGLGSLIPSLAGSPGGGYRTGLTARCPGAAAEPAADGSNPWVPDESICNPAHNHAP